MVRKNRGNCYKKYTVLGAKIGFKGGIKEPWGVGREIFKKFSKIKGFGPTYND
jgi:hypothetical protein